jgi:hypothetical protein
MPSMAKIKIDELECTLADEEAAHQESLRMLAMANARIAELEQRLEAMATAEQVLARIEGTFGASRARVAEVARDVLHRACDSDRVVQELRGIAGSVLGAIATISDRPPLAFAKLEAEIERLRGAEATLLAIEQIIPRNNAHRDYVETVELFVARPA